MLALAVCNVRIVVVDGNLPVREDIAIDAEAVVRDAEAGRTTGSANAVRTRIEPVCVENKRSQKYASADAIICCFLSVSSNLYEPVNCKAPAMCRCGGFVVVMHN